MAKKNAKKPNHSKKNKRSLWKKTPKASTSIVRFPAIVPDRILIPFEYSTNIQITSGGSMSGNIFYGNSLYDPDYTNLGHQPRGYDQWKGFYNKYTVVASKLEVRAIQATSQSLVGIRPMLEVSTPVPSTMAGMIEEPRTKYITCQPGARSKLLSMYIGTGEIFGKSRQSVLDEADFSAATNANPVRVWYWHLQAQHPDMSTSQTVNCLAKITYYAILHTRARIVES